MELQFQKKVIPYQHTVSREVQMQEQTQEVRLTDDMPDIGKVLASWGQVVLRGKEWRSGNAGISGGVMAWVLYAPEDGGAPQSVETWLPFQMKWDVPDGQRDGTVYAVPTLCGVDARSLSARKLMVRVCVETVSESLVPESTELFMPEDLPEDVQILKNVYPMRIPAETGEKAFALEESLQLPSTEPGVRKFVRYNLHPKLIEMKVVTDKLVIRGVSLLDALYLGLDDQIHSWSCELPFSQYAELDREYEAGADARVSIVVTALELELAEQQKITVKGGLTAQFIIYDQPIIEVIGDMYSPLRSIKLSGTQLKLPAILDHRKETVQVEQTVEMNGTGVADAVFYPSQPRLRREEDMVVSELDGLLQLLGYDEEGNLQGVTSHWEGDWKLPASADCDVTITAETAAKPQTGANGTSVGVKSELLLDMLAVDKNGVPMVTGAEMGDPEEPDPERPSLILRKADSDTLWEIAKRAGSTVDAIRKANGIQNEPEPGQMLLIPVL